MRESLIRQAAKLTDEISRTLMQHMGVTGTVSSETYRDSRSFPDRRRLVGTSSAPSLTHIT